MAFKTDRQRKAFFANIGNRRSSNVAVDKVMSRQLKQTRSKELKDTDKDGIPDKFDSNPNDPEKQSRLLDIAKRFLRAREERLETKRENELKKLEDLKDRLKEKRAVTEFKNRKLQEKQAIIDEINKEKRQIQDLKQQNKEAKKLLFQESTLGRGLKISQAVINKTQTFLKKRSSRKSLKNINTAIAGKRTVKVKKRTIKRNLRRTKLIKRGRLPRRRLIKPIKKKQTFGLFG